MTGELRVSGDLTLRDPASGTAVTPKWAASLIALGARLARRANDVRDSQLIIALTVPVRDYAAVLIAAGWRLATTIAPVRSPAEVVSTLSPGTPVRMSVAGTLVAHRFYEASQVGGRLRIHVGSSWWHVDGLDFLAAAPGLPASRFGRVPLAAPGSMVARTGHAKTWFVEQCQASMDVAIIGTRTWLLADLDLEVGWGEPGSGFDCLVDILRPDEGRLPSWRSVIASAQLFDGSSLSTETKLSVLDGSSAIRWLPDIGTPSAVALIDRSSNDEFATESVLQLRSMGLPKPLEQIGWSPTAAVEALAFEIER